MMFGKLIVLILLIVCVKGAAQSGSDDRILLSGIVISSESNEQLEGVKIVSLGNSIQTISKKNGRFELTLKKGKNTIVVSSIGYRDDTIELNLTNNHYVKIMMASKQYHLQDLEIKSTIHKLYMTSNQGVQKITIDDLKDLPALFGEKDILKAMQLLPGIKNGGEGNTGLYVRGGSEDQNLILLDGATFYNSSHLLGFISTFNEDFIKEATIYKAGMPSVYGGRLSSVIDIKSSDKIAPLWSAGGGIGLIASRLKIQGPIIKNKLSVIISARRSYADLLLGFSNDAELKKNQLSFYDMNGKINFQINEHMLLTFSAYKGRDFLGFSGGFGINYGNSNLSSQLKHSYNQHLTAFTTLVYTDFSYNVRVNSGTNNLVIISKIKDFNLKQDIEYKPNALNTFLVGIDLIHHTIVPGEIRANAESGYKSAQLMHKQSGEAAVYISHELNITESVKVNYGIRFHSFSIIGPGNFYSYDAQGQKTDSIQYRSGCLGKTYFNGEPRISISYKLQREQSLKWSFTTNSQNIHLLTNSTASNPTDSYIPSSNNVNPAFSFQYALGYYRAIHHNRYNFSAEIYYKDLRNQIDFKNGAELVVNQDVESTLLFGKGRAYGIELMAKKNSGSLHGWIAYTLSKVEKKINGINNNQWFNATQDRKHEVSVVAVYKINTQISLSAVWVFYSGNPVTLPVSKYEQMGHTFFKYSDRNAYRLPDYHRLDIGITYTPNSKKTNNYWNLSVYNLYNRANPFSINFESEPGNDKRFQAVQTSIFKLIPSISYNIKF